VFFYVFVAAVVVVFIASNILPVPVPHSHFGSSPFPFFFLLLLFSSIFFFLVMMITLLFSHTDTYKRTHKSGPSG